MVGRSNSLIPRHPILWVLPDCGQYDASLMVAESGIPFCLLCYFIHNFMIVILMGVTGSGKTTVGKLLAQQVGWEFADADDFHTPANKEKMSRGEGLTDAERLPWLEAIHKAMVNWESSGQNTVLACSALKESYRGILSNGVSAQFVYLRGSAELILERLGHRKGHYATGELVASQFAALEEPQDAYVVDIASDPMTQVAEIRRDLKL